jgi:hypothetical protein
MWTWDACVPGRSGAGASDDEQRARHTAEEWMRVHQAPTATVEQVRLALGSRNLLTHYERTGIRLAARVLGRGRITWEPTEADEASRASPEPSGPGEEKGKEPS